MVFLRPLVRYGDFSGRARRTEYFGFLLFQTLVGGLFGALAALSLTQAKTGDAPLAVFACVGLAAACALAFAIPHLAVTVRRLHDTGRSAWWLLLQAPSAIAPLLFIGAVLGAAALGGKGSQAAATAIASTAGGAMLLLLVGGICNLVLMTLLWQRGTEGENRFGPDPRGPDGRLNSRDAHGHSGLNEERLDALFAQARRSTEDQAANEARWRPGPSFGPAGAHGLSRIESPGWPGATPSASFGRRRS